MALVTCAELAVMSGRISLRSRTEWAASLMLDGSTAPSGSVTIKAEGGLELVGFVRSGGVDRKLTTHVQVVGGAGGGNKLVVGSYRSAQLRDPLNRAAKVAGDTLSANIAPTLLSTSLGFWTTSERPVRHEYTALARAAGPDVNWRYDPDGKLWLGVESWSAASLPVGAAIISANPALGMTVIAVDTPAINVGVDLDQVGKVLGVDHWIEHDKVRSIVWT